MPSSRASNPLYYSDVQQYYGGGNPIYASEYRNRDGSFAHGAMTGAIDTWRVRGRPTFTPNPGSERIQFWYYSGGWYIRFNPTPTQVPFTAYSKTIGTDMYYYGNSTAASYPTQLSSAWSTNNSMRWFGGLRYYMLQAHNNVNGYRATLGYVWNINSDERLKKDIKFIGVKGTHRIYDWKWNKTATDLGISNMPTRGVLAQEVKEYAPHTVTKDHAGFYKVDYRALGLL